MHSTQSKRLQSWHWRLRATSAPCRRRRGRRSIPCFRRDNGNGGNGRNGGDWQSSVTTLEEGHLFFGCFFFIGVSVLFGVDFDLLIFFLFLLLFQFSFFRIAFCYQEREQSLHDALSQIQPRSSKLTKQPWTQPFKARRNLCSILVQYFHQFCVVQIAFKVAPLLIQVKGHAHGELTRNEQRRGDERPVAVFGQLDPSIWASCQMLEMNLDRLESPINKFERGMIWFAMIQKLRGEGAFFKMRLKATESPPESPGKDSKAERSS